MGSYSDPSSGVAVAASGGAVRPPGGERQGDRNVNVGAVPPALTRADATGAVLLGFPECDTAGRGGTSLRHPVVRVTTATVSGRGEPVPGRAPLGMRILVILAGILRIPRRFLVRLWSSEPPRYANRDHLKQENPGSDEGPARDDGPKP